MRFLAPAAAILSLSTLLGAQDAKPYSEGSVDRFLEQARSNKRPSVVLFNFNFETG